MNRSPLLFASRQRKNHPWIRLDENNNSEQQQIRAARRSRMRLSIETNTTKESKTSSLSMDHPEEPGSIPKRKSPDGISPRSSSTGATFQQYRQQRSVRRHPWRTDVKGRGNRRGVKSWRNLVKAAAPWDECPSIIEEEDEEWISRAESKESDTSVSCGVSLAEDIVKEVSGCTETRTREALQQPPDELLESLRDRLKKVYQGDHHILQSTGTGRGKPSPPVYAQREKIIRQQLVRALQDRLRNYYTGHLVSLEAYGKQGAPTTSLEEKSQDSDERDGSDEGSTVSLDESVVSVQSMIVAATILNSVAPQATGVDPQKEIAVSHAPQPPVDDDEWTEYTLDSRVHHSKASVPATKTDRGEECEEHIVVDEGDSRSAQITRLTATLPSVVRNNSHETEWEEQTVHDEEPQQEDEEWDEETVATEALSHSQQVKLMQSNFPKVSPLEKQQTEDDAEWDEYTVDTATLPEPMARRQKTQDTEWDEYTVESVFNPLRSVPVKDPHQLAEFLASPTNCRKVVTPSVGQPAVEEEDDEWDEYTVETIADALLSLPHALQMHRLHESSSPSKRDLVRRVSDNTSKSPASIAETVKNIVHESKSRLGLFDDHSDMETVSYVDEIIEDEYDDDDHWDDYTVETVADAFASLPRTLQLEFLRTTSTQSVARYDEDQQDDDGSSDCSSAPPEGAFEEPMGQESGAGRDEWTEVTCEETIHDIPGILRQADSAKSTLSQFKNPRLKPIVTDPTLSSTDSESETWHDARSSGSSGPSSSKEVSSASSTGNHSRGSLVRQRRTRSPPTNLNQVLQADIFSQDLTVVEGALRNLSRKADDDLEYRAHIVRSGGILAIVRAMQQNVYKASIQVLACKTLEKIAMDRENRVAIGEVGGVEAVIGAMQEHMAEEPVAEATCGALWVMTSDCSSNQRSIETAALDVVVSCMRRYAKNPTIQEKAFQTLANLCLEDDEKLVALSQMGGFVVMSTALVLHWENPTVKNEAISTLAQLFGRLAVSQNA